MAGGLKIKRDSTMYYVTMTDKFMSNWGVADGKINKLVIECRDFADAEIVEQNAKNRAEMRFVSIKKDKPYYTKKRFVTSFHPLGEYNRWHEAGAF
jgi:hypothetical protein